MDNHPIPQDVTGFQFKLIGDMTVKQFAYLATGAILAWVFFILPLNILIRLPISFILASTGAALAFLPVGGRPLDTMLMRFLEAIFSPNQYIYNKQGGRLLVTQLQLRPLSQSQTTQTIRIEQPDERLNRFLQTLPQAPKNPLEQKEQARFNAIFSNLGASAPAVSPLPIIQPAKPYFDSIDTRPEDTKPEKEIPVKKLETPVAVSQPVIQIKPEEMTQPQHAPQQQSASLQKQLSDLLEQKRELQATPLRPVSPNVMVRTPANPPIAKPAPKPSIPFAPDAPNIIAGIIKDPRGNTLPNILVEVKDKEGNPVRAFKSNALGQFASATPLLNDTYTIAFEDPAETQRFNALEIQTTGEVLPIFEVISTDQREDLRKSLFGGI